MTDFQPDKRGTILSIAGRISHLHIFCTRQFFNRDSGAMSVLAVNVSSVKADCEYDPACILHAGDHSFIRHESYMRYKDAVVMKVERIQSAIETQEIKVLDEVSSEVFLRVMAGFERSRYTKTKIKKLLRELAREEG